MRVHLYGRVLLLPTTWPLPFTGDRLAESASKCAEVKRHRLRTGKSWRCQERPTIRIAVP